MSRVAVIGHFGIGLDLANGQTIKTKIVTDAIEKNTGEKAFLIDAHGGIKAVIPVIFGCIKSLKSCDNIVVMLTENGLKVSVPVLITFNKLFHKKLHYVVIGGWLPKFLANYPRIKDQLKQFNKIYVETNTMREALEKEQFSNIVVMPNCKELTILSDSDLVYQTREPLRICTFSRVMKEKGIEDLVDVVKEINSHGVKYQLDIYGQIDAQQVQWFDNLKNNFSNEITYGGVVPFEKSVETLRNYYMLIFPTLFFTEGVPGTIIDGYAAGVPVLSARWESYSDVVDENVTGVGYEFGSSEALKTTLEYCSGNIEIINEMKENCLRKSREFTIKNAMKVLFNELT